MTVGNVQDVMLTVAAVSGVNGADVPARDVPVAVAQGAARAPRGEVSDAREQDTRAEEAERVPFTEEQTSYIAEQLNEIMRNIDVNLQFQYHKEVNFMSVRMLDKETGDVLREIPPEAMVKHMIQMHDWIGAFLDQTA